MRIAIVGYGSVAALHARGLRAGGQNAGCELASVIGPDAAKAEAFAKAHGVSRSGTDIVAGLREVDAAIICSPSPFHYEQAVQTLCAGVHTLVELPACKSSCHAVQLRDLAEATRLQLECAHTSRYLAPYQLIGDSIRRGILGEIQQMIYVRFMEPRLRSWSDDALLHHAEHPIDLAISWFGAVEPRGCAARPGIPGAQEVTALASTPTGAPVSFSISYTARLAETKMTIIGSRHTLMTDGFSYVTCDSPELNWKGVAQTIYEQAIADQDTAFLRACKSGESAIPWSDTVRLTACIEEFGRLWKLHSKSDL